MNEHALSKYQEKEMGLREFLEKRRGSELDPIMDPKVYIEKLEERNQQQNLLKQQNRKNKKKKELLS